MTTDESIAVLKQVYEIPPWTTFSGTHSFCFYCCVDRLYDWDKGRYVDRHASDCTYLKVEQLVLKAGG